MQRRFIGSDTERKLRGWCRYKINTVFRAFWYVCSSFLWCVVCVHMCCMFINHKLLCVLCSLFDAYGCMIYIHVLRNFLVWTKQSTSVCFHYNWIEQSFINLGFKLSLSLSSSVYSSFSFSSNAFVFVIQSRNCLSFLCYTQFTSNKLLYVKQMAFIPFLGCLTQPIYQCNIQNILSMLNIQNIKRNVVFFSFFICSSQNLDVKWPTFEVEIVDIIIIMDPITNRPTRITIDRPLQIQQIIIIMQQAAKTAKVIVAQALAVAVVLIQTVRVIRIRQTEVKVHKWAGSVIMLTNVRNYWSKLMAVHKLTMTLWTIPHSHSTKSIVHKLLASIETQSS